MIYFKNHLNCTFFQSICLCFALLLIYQLYGNSWIMAWTSDWPPEASADSAAGAQVNAISPKWPEGVEPGSTSPRSRLRADCHGERIFFWQLPPLQFSAVSLGDRWAFHLFLIVSFHHDNLSNYKSVKYQPNHTTLLTVYLLTVHSPQKSHQSFGGKSCRKITDKLTYIFK